MLNMQKKLFFIIFISIFLISCNSEDKEDEGPGPYDEFAKCIGNSDLKMYGSYVCSTCRSQRRIFGSSFKYVGEIECHPQGENSQTELCLEKDIAKTPTWIVETDGQEIKRLEGFQKLEVLAELSGCNLGE